MNRILEAARYAGVAAVLCACCACSAESEPEKENATRAGDVLSLSPSDVLRINFQDPQTTPPAGYLKDFGQAYGVRVGAHQNGLTYGWVVPGSRTPLDLSKGGTIPGNGRNRGTPADVRLATFVHMQATDLPAAFNGTHRDGAWEVAIRSGRYVVLVHVGDASYFNSVHGLRVEGVQAIQSFTPTRSTPFTQAEVVVEVDDGALTVEATGTNTKLDFLEVRLATGVCGNGQVEPGEACDDGNTLRGDGCGTTCQLEPGGQNRPGLDARPDAPAYLGLPSSPDLTSTSWTTVSAFPGNTFLNATGFLEAPTTGHAFVLEREGRMYAVNLNAPAEPRKTVLDLSAVSQGRQDLGLVGVAFHPQFGRRDTPNGRYMYVHYPYTPNPQPSPVPSNHPTESRLSRFTVDLDTLVADPASELVMIAQRDDNIWHQGGALFFHPRDGFLYLTVGDEGGSVCALRNCQLIDKDLFGGVLRIDVDMRGGTVSHPIRKQPESGTTAHYYIPNDNPFVGQPGALEEFYALGLRSPHRMTHDPIDGITWIGDVGQNRFEELNVLGRAANFQWAILEGNSSRNPMPPSTLGVWTNPLLQLGREEARCIIGGFVYRGSKFPELRGKYIFGDYYYGTIWALTYEYDGSNVRIVKRDQLLTGMLGRTASITSFGTDAQGEIYMTSMSRNHVQRLERRAPSVSVPPRLGGTGAFSDVAALTPAPALVPYDVQSPLWSDGAHKTRWVALPSGTSASFTEHGAWQFPEGTVFVKHFELALDERNPSVRRRLETRFLVAGPASKYYGVTYKWNAAQTDATPLLDSLIEPIDVVQADGSTRRQNYFYPGPSDCLVCHNEHAGRVLGVRTAQLNGPYTYAQTGREANQLFTWSRLGMLGTSIAFGSTASYPRLAALGDETRSLEDRVRSYWDSNCSMCHGVDADIRSTWDARYQTPLAQQGVLYGSLAGEVEFPEGTYVVVPGSRTRSAMWERDRSNDVRVRMPPIGRSRTDVEYITLLERWIDSLPRTEPPAVPTCFDNLENGDETAVDCGGTCPACCVPATYEAETMFHQVGGAITDGWNIRENGYIETEHRFGQTGGTLLISARGKIARNVWPTMVVSIGGVVIGTVSVSSADWATYSVPFEARPGISHVRITFNNDLYAPPEDRNLYVDKLQITCSGD